MPVPQESDGEITEDLSITAKHKDDEPSNWKITARNRRILKNWAALLLNTQENAINCYDWLRKHATQHKPKRCYPLRGRVYDGHWAYEIGAGDRIYYKPNEETKTASIWYAGPHPKDGIPIPPKGI